MLVFKDFYKCAVFSIFAKQTSWFFQQRQGTFFLKILYVCIHPSIDVTIEARCSRALPRQPDRYDIRRQGRTAQTQNTRPGNTEENISNFSWTFLSFVEPSKPQMPKKDLSSLLTEGTVNCKSFSWNHVETFYLLGFYIATVQNKIVVT